MGPSRRPSKGPPSDPRRRGSEAEVEGFEGFGGHHDRWVNVPDVFFTTLVPKIRSVVELKVTLHLMWVLSQRVGRPRCIEFSDLARDGELLESVKVDEGPRPAEDYLREGLELAVTRGSVLQVQLRRGEGRQRWYFLNTAASRQTVERLQSGSLEAAPEIFGSESIDEVRVYRPNIFALYEQNVGPLTPIMADRLRAAERQFPTLWIEEAIGMAVEYNRRNWRYVETILRRWQAEGKDAGPAGRPGEEDADLQDYFRTKYEHLYR